MTTVAEFASEHFGGTISGAPKPRSEPWDVVASGWNGRAMLFQRHDNHENAEAAAELLFARADVEKVAVTKAGNR